MHRDPSTCLLYTSPEESEPVYSHYAEPFHFPDVRMKWTVGSYQSVGTEVGVIRNTHEEMCIRDRYKGRIVKTAGPELALELEERGYDWIKAELGE